MVFSCDGSFHVSKQCRFLSDSFSVSSNRCRYGNYDRRCQSLGVYCHCAIVRITGIGETVLFENLASAAAT